MIQNLYKRKTGATSGFTIIEVMIVLAIAGLIMLIVFLAVPALQRNARNTQRKSDAAAIASAIANYIDNNGGTLPTKVGAGATTGDLTVCGATTNTETAKLGYYTSAGGNAACAAASGNVSIAGPVANATTPAIADENTVVIETGENCDATGTQAGAKSSRSAAIFYGLEGGSGVTVQCLEQ